MFLAAFFALQAESAGRKTLFWALTVLQFVGIVLSVTRGAIVGLFAGVVFAAAVYVGLQANRAIKIIGGTAIAIGVILVAGLFIYHKKLPDNRLTRLFKLEDNNSQARLIQWKSAIIGYKDYPIFGVGPENYYVISNKYYDPQIVKYDPSWFDKPHNYVLEVLVTTGALGFIAYAAMLSFVTWALWRAYRTGFLNLPQMCVLVAGFASYFVQNLFVFDTIAASLMFYAFVGFGMYLWDEAAEAEVRHPATGIRQQAGAQSFAMAAGLVALVVAIYAAYVTNIEGLQAAKAVNYGYAYASVDPAVSVNYFQSAINSSFNFDPQDTAERFSDSVSTMIQSSQTDVKTLSQYLNQATDYERQTAQAIGNDPISWQKLATDYYLQSALEKTPLSAAAETAAQRAIAWAPKRFEPIMFQGQLYMAEGDNAAAAAVFKSMTQTFPLVNYTAPAWWSLATADHAIGQDSEALQIVGQMARQGYAPRSPQDIAWVPSYYDGKKDYASEIAFYQQALKWFADPGLAFGLAQTYAKAGQIPQARELATELLQASSTSDSNKQVIQQFLNTLK